MSDMSHEGEETDCTLPDISESSITDLFGCKHLSKSINKLIDAVSSHIGIRHEPTRIIKTAKAEAKAAIIRAKAEAKAKGIELRANNRLFNLEMRRQRNIESIVKGAAYQLPQSVSETQPNEDWMHKFFTCCQDIGDAELHSLWSKILAGEVARPGRFSLRTLNLLNTLTKDEAHKFTRLCSLVMSDVSGGMYIHYNHQTEAYMDSISIYLRDLLHFRSIGLIDSTDVTLELEKPVSLNYFNQRYRFSRPDATGFLGVIKMSKIAEELVPIAGADLDTKFIDCVLTSLGEHNIDTEKLD